LRKCKTSTTVKLRGGGDKLNVKVTPARRPLERWVVAVLTENGKG